MVGKMTKNEKVLASLSLILLIVTIVVRCIVGTANIGVLVILSFTGVLMWLIFFVCSFFPADWRMTEKQRDKIKNPAEYQNKYRKIMIGLDTFITVMFAVLILVFG